MSKSNPKSKETPDKTVLITSKASRNKKNRYHTHQDCHALQKSQKEPLEKKLSMIETHYDKCRVCARKDEKDVLGDEKVLELERRRQKAGIDKSTIGDELPSKSRSYYRKIVYGIIDLRQEMYDEITDTLDKLEE